MEIYSLNLKSKNNPNIFLINTNQGEFVIHSDLIVKYNIKLGTVDENKFYLAKKESEILIATNLTLNYINARMKTIKHIKDYLIKKKFDIDVINEVIKKLEEYKIIDDNEYAKAYVRSNSNLSKMKIKQKLLQSGVNKNFIDDALENVNEYESCFNSAKKFLKSNEMTKSGIEKLTRRLNYQGYSWETIKKVLSNLTNKEFK